MDLLMIICFIIGTALILMEAFMPGFGAAGIAGVILEIVAIVCISRYGTDAALIATFLVLLLIGLAIFLSYRSVVRGRLSKSPLVLKNEESAAPPEGASSAPDKWVGKDGVVATPLRPAGFIEIGGVRLSAATSGAFLEKGTAVLVEGVQGDHLLVSRKS